MTYLPRSCRRECILKHVSSQLKLLASVAEWSMRVVLLLGADDQVRGQMENKQSGFGFAAVSRLCTSPLAMLRSLENQVAICLSIRVLLHFTICIVGNNNVSTVASTGAGNVASRQRSQLLASPRKYIVEHTTIGILYADLDYRSLSTKSSAV